MNRSLYQSKLEHDACGVGFVVDIHGRESHDILEKAIRCVVNLTHRGAVDADAKTGDGAGVLTQIPRALFKRELAKNKIELKDCDLLGVGMVFFPKDDTKEKARQIIDELVNSHGMIHWGWRIVPVDDSCLGQKASLTQPHIEQIMMGCNDEIDLESFERKLFLIRKKIENKIASAGIQGFYIPSFSSRTILLAKGRSIEVDDLPTHFTDHTLSTPPPDSASIKDALEVPEKIFIEQALKNNHGNRQKTARMLKVNRSTLYNKMKKYDLLNYGKDS